MNSLLPATGYEVADIMRGIYGDGIIACRGAFERGLIEELGADIDLLFREAQARPGGVTPAGGVR